MEEKSISKTFELIVKTQAGLEELLAEELKAVGAQEIEILTRAVKCVGDNKVMYKANYLCRTAMKVLKPIATFAIRDEENLYKQCKQILWTKYMELDKTFAVDGTVSSNHIRHSKYASLKVKDAIADYFRELEGQRPNVDPINPDLRVNLHIYNERCTISIDSSGDSLHKRHYRVEQGEAPINEVLAAGLVLLSGWNKNVNFYDPMCGSGTILIEAAMIAMNIPAGYYRRNFGFQGWKDYNAELFDEIKNEADDLIQDTEIEFYGSDQSSMAIDNCYKNVKNAKLHKDIILKVESFEDVKPDADEGIIVMNPPYNERIELDDQIDFHKMIGNTLKQNFSGFNAWLITSNLASLKFVGLRPSRKIKVYNGPLECRFAKFEMYRGTKKLHKLRDE